MLMMIAMINDVYASEVCIMYNDENTMTTTTTKKKKKTGR